MSRLPLRMIFYGLLFVVAVGFPGIARELIDHENWIVVVGLFAPVVALRLWLGRK